MQQLAAQRYSWWTLLRLVPETLVEDFVELVLDSYDRYVTGVCFFMEGAQIPSALEILLYDVERYGSHSEIHAFLLECIGQCRHEQDERYPDPRGPDWTDADTEKCAILLADGWEIFQREVIHDMEVVLRQTNVMFWIPETQKAINPPIIGVW